MCRTARIKNKNHNDQKNNQKYDRCIFKCWDFLHLYNQTDPNKVFESFFPDLIWSWLLLNSWIYYCFERDGKCYHFFFNCGITLNN